MDPELRDAFDRITADLRGEIRAGDAETREALRSGDGETREALDRLGADLRGEFRAAVVEMRRHFDVVAESLRSDISGVAEGTALLSQRTDGRFGESGERTDRLEGRVLKLEVRVSRLEDGRKPGRLRRRR